MTDAEILAELRYWRRMNGAPIWVKAIAMIEKLQKEKTMDEIYPAPEGFSVEQLAADPILRYFHFAHLPPQLQAVSVKFYELAASLIALLPRNAERTVALRKLLEAKDAAVRAAVG